jgi:serine/threonine-protein kinase
MRARLRAVLGRAYLNLEQSRRAEPMLRQAADELQAPGVDLPREAWSALHSLSILLSNHSRPAEAIPVARRSLALAERIDDISIISMAWNNLGVALRGADRYDQAEAALNRALALRRRMQAQGGYRNNNEDDDSTILHNLGLVLKGRGDYAGAERYYRQALAGKRVRYGERSYVYRSSLAGLAGTLARQGRLREAAALQEQSLQLAYALFGEQNDAVVNAHNDLAGTYRDMGRFAPSSQHYARAMDISRSLEGEDTLDYAGLLNNFAMLQEARGDIGAAESLYRQSLRIRRDKAGSQARASLNTEARLGSLLLRSGRLAQAEPLLARTSKAMAALLGPDHPDMLSQRLTQPELWMYRGELARARRTLASVRPASGWPSPVLKARHDALEAQIDQRAGDYAAAAAIWGRLIDESQAGLDASAVPLAKLRLSLAETLAAAGDRTGARQQLALAGPPLKAQLAVMAEPLRRLQAVESALR